MHSARNNNVLCDNERDTKGEYTSPNRDMAQAGVSFWRSLRVGSRYAMVGTVPPPFGGVSIHVSRLANMLRANGIECRVYEQQGKSDVARGLVPLGRSPFRFLCFLLLYKDTVLHLQFNSIPALCLAGVVLPLRNRSFVLTVHSERVFREYANGGLIKRRLLQRVVRNASALVCVSEAIANSMQLIDDNVRKRTHVIPAYLPPQADELDPQNIPHRVQSFMNLRRKIIVSHGWFGYFLDDGHVYGFDLLVELARHLKGKDDGRGLVTVVSGCYDSGHREKVLRVNEGLSDVWLIVEEPFSAASLYGQASVFVRPSRTDGDSVSIRECLSLGVPVVASDAVARPVGCMLFPSGNSGVFLSLVDQVSGSRQSQPVSTEEFEGMHDLIAVIRNVCRLGAQSG